MATQYTSILKLALPTTGELSGTWGDVVNDNITSMVEEAVAGRAVINSWTANTHTLTTANGTTSESRCAMLELTDTGTQLTGAGEVICPTASKIYIVKNAAGQSITIKTSAGTGVAIANGQTKFVFCDGTNVVEAITSIATLDATTGNITTVNATTVDTTNIEVTNIKAKDGTAAGSIADSTGVVTLSSVVLTTADINGGTIDGVSIGASAVATVINVDNLSLDGNTLASTDTNGNVVIAPNGTGDVQLDADTVRVGDSNVDVTVTTNGTGDLILNTNAGSDSGVIRIYDGSNGNIALTPNGTGEVDISKVDIDGGTIDGTTIGGTTPAAITGTTITGTSFVTSGDMTFGDNDKAIFGAGSDLQIYHDGSHSYIDDAGTGLLRLRSNTIYLEKYTGELLADFNADGYVSLLHDNSEKFRTTSAGVDVTGTVTADGLTVDGAGDFVGVSGVQLKRNLTPVGAGSGANLLNWQLVSTGSTYVTGASIQGISDGAWSATSAPMFLSMRTVESGTTTLKERMRISNNGDIQFYEDTGTTPKLTWDASAEALGIGTSSPTNDLHVSSNSSTKAVFERTGSTGAYIGLKDSSGSLVYLGDNNGTFEVQTAGSSYSTKLAVTSTGNVGIGTSSPASALNMVGDQAIFSGGTGTLNLGLQIKGAVLTTIPSAQVQGYIGTGDSTIGVAGDLLLAPRTSAAANIRFITGTSPAERMRITSSGNVGIGTSSPAGNVEINDPTSATVRIGNPSGVDLVLTGGATGASGSAGGGINVPTASPLVFLTSNTERMRIDSSGNVGIGTSNPARLFTVSAGAGSSILAIQDANTGNTATDGFQLQLASAGDMFLWNYENASTVFGTNNTERMRIDSSGNVGIGTTSPNTLLTTQGSVSTVYTSTGSAAFPSSGTFTDIVNTDTTSGASAFQRFSVAGASGTSYIYHGAIGGGASGTGQYVIGRRTGSATYAESIRIDSSGNVLMGGTTAGTASAGNLVLFNGTAPTGNVTNGITLYAEDVSSSSELKVRDEAGNVTTLSPHNFDLIPEGPSEEMAWSYYSERDGKRINVDMLKAIRLLEQISGEKLVHMV